jgi:hypothetical protein
MVVVPMHRMGETLEVRFNIYTFLPGPHNEDVYVHLLKKSSVENRIFMYKPPWGGEIIYTPIF